MLRKESLVKLFNGHLMEIILDEETASLTLKCHTCDPTLEDIIEQITFINFDNYKTAVTNINDIADLHAL